MAILTAHLVAIATDPHQTSAKMVLVMCVQLLKAAGAEKIILVKLKKTLRTSTGAFPSPTIRLRVEGYKKRHFKGLKENPFCLKVSTSTQTFCSDMYFLWFVFPEFVGLSFGALDEKTSKSLLINTD